MSFGYGERMGLKPEMQTGVNAYALYRRVSKSSKQFQIRARLMENMNLHVFNCTTPLWGRGDIVKETTLRGVQYQRQSSIGIKFLKYPKIILNLM